MHRHSASHPDAEARVAAPAAGPFEPVAFEKRKLVLEDRSGTRLAVSAWAPDLFRVEYAPPWRPAPTVGWALARPEEAWPDDFELRLGEAPEGWSLSTPRAALHVSRRTGAVLVQAEGHPAPIARDDPERPVAIDSTLRCRKELPPGAMCLGLGEKTGWLDRRERVLEMWNTDILPHNPATDPLYQSIPLLVVYESGRAWGLFLHNTHRSTFDLAFTDPRWVELAVDGGRLEYFVLTGPTLDRVVERYTELTGRMPLPPRWALGFQQSRWGYESADEVRAVAQELRRRGIPCDAIYLDIDYMDGFRVFTWHPQRFPDPAGLMRELHESGFRVVAIVDPGVKIDAGYPVYREGLRQGYFCARPDGRPFEGRVWPGPTMWPDFARAEVRRWWGDWHRVLLDAGVDGIWNDMNEPANFRDRPGADTLDRDVVHGPDEERPQGERRELAHAEFHNVYGLLMSQAAYEAQLRLRPGVRPFVLSRAGFAGIQRYAAVWTGDNSSWWEHLAMMVPQLVNLGLSGVAFAGVDVGGFAGHATGELLARWTQAGAFVPLFRNHSARDTRRQEVWRFGEAVEAICRRYIEWRYRMLPYLYTLFWEAASRGTPVMRPLFWHAPGDAEAERVQDQWLLGPHVLVAPVCRPGERRRMVYVPQGEWVHLWRPLRLSGPAHAVVEAPLEEIPVLVRAGAPLPLGPLAEHTGQLVRDGRLSIWTAAPSSIALARGEGASWTYLYEDDGETLAYREGAFARQRVDARWAAGRTGMVLHMDMSAREGSFRPARGWLEFVVDRAEAGPPVAVRWQHRAVERAREGWRPVFEDRVDPEAARLGPWCDRPAWHFDESSARLSIRVPDPSGGGRLEVEWETS